MLYNRQYKKAACVIHFVDVSVNKLNIKVFTYETFAATVEEDNIRSNWRLLKVLWQRNSWI